MPRPKKIKALYIIIGVVFLSIVIGITSDYFIRTSEEELNQPNISYNTINGSTIELSTHQGKVVLLYFFFLNCPACQPTYSFLAAIEDDYSNSQLYILTITIDPAETDGSLYNWRNNLNATWDIARDDISHSYSAPWNVAYTPTVILIDQAGIFIYKIIGATDFDIRVRTGIEALL